VPLLHQAVLDHSDRKGVDDGGHSKPYEDDDGKGQRRTEQPEQNSAHLSDRLTSEPIRIASSGPMAHTALDSPRRRSMKPSSIISCIAIAALLSLHFRPSFVSAQQNVTMDTPAEQAAPPPSSEPCPKGKRGGAVGGIVVGSIFWWLLPMSIPVLITQTKKLRAHRAAQAERRCQYAPRN
jgi:hypothetical protein